MASVPVQLIVTGWLYQPLKSGAREELAVRPVGGVASILIGLVVTVVIPPMPVAEQVSVMPAVGPGIVTVGGHVVEL